MNVQCTYVGLGLLRGVEGCGEGRVRGFRVGAYPGGGGCLSHQNFRGDEEKKGNVEIRKKKRFENTNNVVTCIFKGVRGGGRFLLPPPH